MTLKAQNEAINAEDTLDRKLARRKLERTLRASLARMAYEDNETARLRAARERMERL